MIPRTAEKALRHLRKGYPAIAITGPRQSGKTTLAKAVFKDLPYVSFENPDLLFAGQSDPRAFLHKYKSGAVFDEVQRFPELTSYLQQIIDEGPKTCRFVLTGSQQFGLHSQITQSLAGRCALIHLLPFSFSELYGRKNKLPSLESVLFGGFYPPIFDRKLAPRKWYADYVQSYIERDVRQLVNIKDLRAFQLFLRMCAARTGQLLNLSSIAADCGITHNTAKSWTSILEASYIVFLLRPFHNNLGKRLTKMPKLYFYDTGLLSYLLGIREAKELHLHAHRGPLFEAFLIGEAAKKAFNDGFAPSIYYWRDHKGMEIDLIVESSSGLQPIEIKSGRTVAADWFNALTKWVKIAGSKARHPAVIYGGEEEYKNRGITVLPWKKIDSWLKKP